MATVIRDEKDLPAAPLTVERNGTEYPNPVRVTNYVRSLCDPRTYVHPYTGENFVREDGQNWKSPGFSVMTADSGAAVRSAAGAYGDSKIYEYA